jgi:phosphoadenosine phosphosulfate reductase
MAPGDLLAWAHEAYGGRAAIITSFQYTGCVMIDMAYSRGVPLRVATIDTLRLHQETYDLMDAVERRYGLAIERFQPDPERVAAMVRQHGEYLFFDSQPKQEFCCKIRKVEPNLRALASVDCWITGLRRDQSPFRSNIPKASVVEQEGRQLLKLCPLIDWTEEDARAYIDARGIPYNPLYDQGYASIGCMICTTPIQEGEDKRAGRWRWFNHLGSHQKECGIHKGGSGI